MQKLREKIKPQFDVIDMHVHPYSRIGDFRPPSPEAAADRIIAVADAFGVSKIVVFDVGDEANVVSPDAAAMREINDNLLRVRDRHKRRFAAFAYLNPARPEESARELDRCISHGVCGVKLWISRRANHAGTVDLLRYVAGKGLPMVQHCSDKSFGNEPGETCPSDAVECAKLVPEAVVVLAHLTNIGLRGIEEIRDCPNIIAECSGGDPLSGFVRRAIDRLGVERVVFGSDIPCRNFGSQLAKVINDDIPVAEQEQILYKNPTRIVRWSE